MVEKKKNSDELDELQKSIDSAAKEATKIKVDFKDESISDSEESATLDEAEKIDLKEEDEPASDSELDEMTEDEDHELTQEELEKEFEDSQELEEVAEEPKKQAGPAGPYQPVVPESSYGEEDAEAAVFDDVSMESETEEVPEEENKDSVDNTELQEEPEEKDLDSEVDSMLSVEQQQAQAAAAGASEEKKKKSLFGKIKYFFVRWWRNKKARYGTLLLLFALFTLTAFVPAMRYGALNLVGVRVSTSLTIVDSQTGLPLKNIPVTLAGVEARSGEDGLVEFTEMKLGDTTLVIDKLGYAKLEKELTLGFGSNPLGPQSLSATGEQYRFRLVDWLSDQPITEAEAQSGEDIAQTDAEGRIQLTVGELDEQTVVTIRAEGYRDETIGVTELNDDVNAISLVQGKKHAFVSNRNGEYDLYKIDVDGQNEEILLQATGQEREIPFVLPHQTRDEIAFISSRDGETNKDNFILDGLFIINTQTNDVEKVTRSEQLQLIGWMDNKLIYVSVIEGVSAGNPQRSKVISFDLETRERIELASANYFNDVKIVNDSVYYSVSSAAVPASRAKLYSINSDGTNKQLVVDTQVWSIVRADYNTLYFNAIDREWYEQEIGQAPQKIDTEPTDTLGRKYVDNPNGEKSVWVDIRDGKGVLIVYDTKTEEDLVVLTESGVTNPVHWIGNDVVIYRVDTSGETADYILNLDGGDPQKISDVVGNHSRYFF